jgi:hypothetical protein
MRGIPSRSSTEGHEHIMGNPINANDSAPIEKRPIPVNDARPDVEGGDQVEKATSTGWSGLGTRDAQKKAAAGVTTKKMSAPTK